jgi:hypothetical protein
MRSAKTQKILRTHTGKERNFWIFENTFNQTNFIV